MAKETKPVVHVRARKSQPAAEYDYDTHGKVDSGGMSPKFITQEFIDQVSLEGPRGWDEAKIPFTVRIWPAINPDNTDQFMKYRKVDAPLKFTDWFRAVPSVKYVGIGKNKQVTFFLYDPRWISTENYEFSTNPYHILFQEFHSAVKADKAQLGKRDVLTRYWYNMVCDSKVREKRAFCKPSVTYLFQGFVYTNNKSLVKENLAPAGAGRKDRTPIIMLTKSTGESLIKQLRVPTKTPPEDPTNVSGQFVHGDITRLKAGKFVSFYHPSMTETMAMKYPKDMELAQSLMPQTDEEDKGSFESYEVLLHSTCSVIPEKQKRPTILTPDISQYANEIRSHYMWWDDILYFPSHEEIALILAQAYRDVPDIIKYGWRDNPEFMTSEVKAILAAAVTGAGADIPGDDDDVPTGDGEDDAPSPSRKPKRSPAIPEVSDEDYSEFSEDEDDVEAETVADFDDTVDEEEEAPKPSRVGQQARSKIQQIAKEEEEAEAEGDEEEGDAPAAKPKPLTKPAAKSAAKPAAKPAPKLPLKKPAAVAGKPSVQPPKRRPPQVDENEDPSEEEVMQALEAAKSQGRKRR